MARHPALVDPLRLMEELALRLMEKRQARGSLDFDLPEAEIILDIQGGRKHRPRRANIAHRIIEEFMIAANEAVARHLTEKGFPLLYRVHEGPEEDTFQALIPFLLSLGYRPPMKRGKISSGDIQKLLDPAAGNPRRRC